MTTSAVGFPARCRAPPRPCSRKASPSRRSSSTTPASRTKPSSPSSSAIRACRKRSPPISTRKCRPASWARAVWANCSIGSAARRWKPASRPFSTSAATFSATSCCRKSPTAPIPGKITSSMTASPTPSCTSSRSRWRRRVTASRSTLPAPIRSRADRSTGRPTMPVAPSSSNGSRRSCAISPTRPSAPPRFTSTKVSARFSTSCSRLRARY